MRENEVYNLVCFGCERSIEVATDGAGRCPRCGMRLAIDWQASARDYDMLTVAEPTGEGWA
jgi:rRNA maturation endonuclease Nob1